MTRKHCDFDALLYGIELAYLAGKLYTRGRSELLKKAKAVASVSNIPEIDQKRALLVKNYPDRLYQNCRCERV